MSIVRNAICVSVSQLYQQIRDEFVAPPEGAPHVLHTATSFAWRVNPDNAAHVRYAFGIAAGKVVSAYRIKVPAADWPVMPSDNGGPAQGRRVLPLIEVSPEEWAIATSWPGVQMVASMRYAHLQIGSNGVWERLFVPDDSLTEEEQSDDPGPSQ